MLLRAAALAVAPTAEPLEVMAPLMLAVAARLADPAAAAGYRQQLAQLQEGGPELVSLEQLEFLVNVSLCFEVVDPPTGIQVNARACT